MTESTTVKVFECVHSGKTDKKAKTAFYSVPLSTFTVCSVRGAPNSKSSIARTLSQLFRDIKVPRYFTLNYMSREMLFHSRLCHFHLSESQSNTYAVTAVFTCSAFVDTLALMKLICDEHEVWVFNPVPSIIHLWNLLNYRPRLILLNIDAFVPIPIFFPSVFTMRNIRFRSRYPGNMAKAYLKYLKRGDLGTG